MFEFYEKFSHAASQMILIYTIFVQPNLKAYIMQVKQK